MGGPSQGFSLSEEKTHQRLQNEPMCSENAHPTLLPGQVLRKTRKGGDTMG